jgi:hypothetical protein
LVLQRRAPVGGVALENVKQDGLAPQRHHAGGKLLVLPGERFQGLLLLGQRRGIVRGRLRSDGVAGLVELSDFAHQRSTY